MLRRATWTRPISDIPRVVSSTCLFRTGLTKHCSFTPCALNSKFWVSHLIVATLTGLTQSCTQSEIRRRAFRKKLQGACQGVPWPFLMVDRGVKVSTWLLTTRAYFLAAGDCMPARVAPVSLWTDTGAVRCVTKALWACQNTRPCSATLHQCGDHLLR